jgi:hypothetical protein
VELNLKWLVEDRLKVYSGLRLLVARNISGKIGRPNVYTETEALLSIFGIFGVTIKFNKLIRPAIGLTVIHSSVETLELYKDELGN